MKPDVRSCDLGIVNHSPGSLRAFLFLRQMANTIIEGDMIFMNIRNEIKAYIIREGFTMSELVEKLADQYGWSPSVPNLSDKLRRESLRYKEAVELADALGYDLVWQKRR